LTGFQYDVVRNQKWAYFFGGHPVDPPACAQPCPAADDDFANAE